MKTEYIRVKLSIFCLFFCFPGMVIAVGVSQQVSSRVEAQVDASAVSRGSSPESNSKASGQWRTNGISIDTGFLPLGVSTNSASFFIMGSSGQSNPRARDAFDVHAKTAAGFAQSNVFQREHMTGTHPNSIAGKTFKFSGGGGAFSNGVTTGQFPDSTRETVLPSPLLSGNSLHFFGIQMPGFSPLFDSERHLNPSYAVTPSGGGHSSRTRRHFRPTRSLSSGLPSIPSTSFGSQIHPTLRNDPLQSNSIADPLKSRSIGWLNTNQPN